MGGYLTLLVVAVALLWSLVSFVNFITPDKKGKRVLWMPVTNTRLMRTLVYIPLISFVFTIAIAGLLKDYMGNTLAISITMFWIFVNIFLCMVAAAAGRFAYKGRLGKLLFGFYLFAGCAYGAIAALMLLVWSISGVAGSRIMV
jgi:hypothetical protein